jgi:glycosyltransferase involved in cell wall biosynthesis
MVVERVLDRITDAYLVNCAAITRELAERGGIDRAKIHVIPNGIDLARLPPFERDRRAARAAMGFDPERRLVAQVGRLSAQKDYPTFLRAAATIAAAEPDVDFLVVGDGELRGELEALAVSLGIGGRVRFMGQRDDVPALLGGVDVLALTSLFEGLPNVVIEAMATGAVAVATDVGGCRELIVPDETGLLVSPGDPAGVVTAVRRVLRDPALGYRLAIAARRHVEDELAVEAMARRTMARYETLLGARGEESGRAAA